MEVCKEEILYLFNQSVYQTTKQLNGVPKDQFNSQSRNQTIIQSINQTVVQSILLTIKQRINQIYD